MKISHRVDVDQRPGSGWCWNEKRERILFERGFASQGESGTEIENAFFKKPSLIILNYVLNFF